MSDTDVPLHEYLKEVLGYLQILGKNLQKRTKNISENRINEKYLNSPENLKKTSDKINLICNLSKASIDKVQDGVKKALDSYIQKSARKTNVSHIKSATENSTGTLVSKGGTSTPDSNHVRELGPEKSSEVEDSTHEVLSTRACASVLGEDKISTKIQRDKNGFEWIKYQKRKLFLPAHINIEEYFNCSVKVAPFHKDTFDKHKVANVGSICSEKVYTEDTPYNTNKSRTKPKLSVSKEVIPNNCLSHQDKKKKLEISDLENIKGTLIDLKKDDKPLEKPKSDPNKVSQIKHSDMQGSKKKFKRVFIQESSDSDNGGPSITVTAQNIKQDVSPNSEENLKKCVSPSNCITQKDSLMTEVLTKCKINNTEIATQIEIKENQNTFSNGDQSTDQFLEKVPSTSMQDKRTDENSLSSRNEESDSSNIKPCDNGSSNINDKRKEHSLAEQELENMSNSAEKKCKKIETIHRDDNKSESNAEKKTSVDVSENEERLKKSSDNENKEEDKDSHLISDEQITFDDPIVNSKDELMLDVADHPIISSLNKDHLLNKGIKDKAMDNNIANDLLKSSQNRKKVREDGESGKNSSVSKNKRPLLVDNLANEANLNNVDDLITCSERKNHSECDDRVSEDSDINDSLTNSQSKDKEYIDGDKYENYSLPDSGNKKKSEESNQHIDTECNQISKVIGDELPTCSQNKELACDDNDKQSNFSTDSVNKKQLSDVSSVIEAVLPISESVEQVSLGSDELSQLLDTSNKNSTLPISESIDQVDVSPSEKCPQSQEVVPEKVEENVTTEPQQKAFIRCVNIANLLASDVLEVPTEPQKVNTANLLASDVLEVPTQPQKKKGVLPRIIRIAKPRKIVTFLDDPIEILCSPEKIIDRRQTPTAKSPPSILLKGKEVVNAKLKRIQSHKMANNISSNSDYDISSSTQELFKRIKLDILDGRCQAFVNLVREPLDSWAYAESLAKYGIKKVYSELGELYSKEAKNKSVDMVNENAKQADSSGSLDSDKTKHELNEEAKRSVLNSSSSSDSGDVLLNSSAVNKSKTNITCSDSVSDVNNPSSDLKKKKKFSKRRHKNQDPSDSEAEIESFLSLPKRKRERSRKSSIDCPLTLALEESTCNSADEENNESDEMGRSLRLKGRTEPAASPEQSKKERNTSHASTTSDKDKAGDSLSKKSQESSLLDTLLNGDLASPDRSASDIERSCESGNEPKESNSKATFSEKPMERIKNDLLDDTSSSARESPGKVNGKGKAAKNDEDGNESDKDVKNEREDADSDSSSGVKNRSKGGSIIELDSESEPDSDEKPRKKKSAQNGKNSDSEALDDDNDKESETDESEIFVPSRRKRKPKSKSSGDSSDDSEKGKSKNKRRRIKKLSGDESSGGSGDSSGSDGENNKKGRKNIRALKKSSNLGSATRIAARKEKERVARIAERQKLYNESLFDESGKPDEVIQLDKVVLDFDPETKEPSISVDKGLVAKLKPHQANGIKFMWDACFESEKQIKEKDKGSGCILAHCMGLGKTLQVVTLVHTLLTHREQTKVERVLVVCPLSTVLNWVNEFKMWLEHANSEEEINIFELSRFKQNYERSYQLKEWLEFGGVCILGYDMFRNLSADNSKKFKKAQLNTFQKALIDPGPHLVVCDEGHLLKNEKTSISQSMNRVKTLRRIVLTGTPLQNNLKEYYCMVQFVKPDLLGKYNEYLNRFVNPITNGQYTNSTEHDIRVMKRRSHVLHTMLEGAVQRRDYAVLAPFLPPKHEYVLFISLTEIQIKLYAHYLENYSRRPNPDRKTTPSLFADFQSLQRIWTHPLVLKANSERYELLQQKKRDKEEDDDSEGSLADFIDDGEEETTTPQETSMSESEHSDGSDGNKKDKNKKKGKHSKVKHKRVTRANAVKVDDEEHEPEMAELPDQPRSENPTEWWMSLCSEEELDAVRHSNKLLLLLDILKMCEAIGDKLLVFSQSLYSLDLIEQFLSKIDDATQKGEPDENLAGHVGSWSQGLDYFRLDGSTSCENRAIWCKAFNREDNPRARLFLISTRAGGLGINLFAANRVVIFDMSWNPSHDVQSIFRVYRFGQKKPCYIYRFLALGTMEEKIYERQVTKQAISKRVIDEQQIDRHYTESDLAELYIFCPVPEGQREVPKLPKDRLFADLLKQHDKIIYKYHEHDSLLENKEEETLTEEERKAAWDDYENEKTRPPPAIGGTNWLQGLQQQHQQQQMTMNALGAVLRQDYPSLSEQQIASMIPAILQQMYTNGDAGLSQQMYPGYDYGLMQKMNAMMTAQNSMMGFKYPQSTMLAPGMLGMNPASMGVAGVGGVAGMGGVGMRGAPMYQQSWQQQQQMQLQRLQQQQAMQANMKYYAGGLGSRDMIDMAALQQQQRALLMGAQGNLPQRGRPPKGPPKQTQEVVDLDSE